MIGGERDVQYLKAFGTVDHGSAQRSRVERVETSASNGDP